MAIGNSRKSFHEIAAPAYAAGDQVKSLDALPPGRLVKAIIVELSCTVQNAADATSAVATGTYGTVAEGGDDFDKLFTAVASFLKIQLAPGNWLVKQESPQRLRTLIAQALKLDPANGFARIIDASTGTALASFPASSGSAKTVKLSLRVPVAIDPLFDDGIDTSMGSNLVRNGDITYTGTGATSFTNAAGATINIGSVSFRYLFDCDYDHVTNGVRVSLVPEFRSINSKEANDPALPLSHYAYLGITGTATGNGVTSFVCSIDAECKIQGSDFIGFQGALGNAQYSRGQARGVVGIQTCGLRACDLFNTRALAQWQDLDVMPEAPQIQLAGATTVNYLVLYLNKPTTDLVDAVRAAPGVGTVAQLPARSENQSATVMAGTDATPKPLGKVAA